MWCAVSSLSVMESDETVAERRETYHKGQLQFYSIHVGPGTRLTNDPV